MVVKSIANSPDRSGQCAANVPIGVASSLLQRGHSPASNQAMLLGADAGAHYNRQGAGSVPTIVFHGDLDSTSFPRKQALLPGAFSRATSTAASRAAAGAAPIPTPPAPTPAKR